MTFPLEPLKLIIDVEPGPGGRLDVLSLENASGAPLRVTGIEIKHGPVLPSFTPTKLAPGQRVELLRDGQGDHEVARLACKEGDPRRHCLVRFQREDGTEDNQIIAEMEIHDHRPPVEFVREAQELPRGERFRFKIRCAYCGEHPTGTAEIITGDIMVKCHVCGKITCIVLMTEEEAHRHERARRLP